MDILLYFYIFLLILIVLFSIGSFKDSKPMFKKISMICILILTFCIGYISFGAYPTNFLISKAIVLIITLSPLLLIFLFFTKKLNEKLYKILSIVILILNYLTLLL